MYHYLAAALNADTAQTATEQLFAHPDVARTLAANWKQMPQLHPDLKELLRQLLVPLAGWERAVARDHAGRILDILLKN